MEEQELKIDRGFNAERLKDVAFVVGGAALIFYVGNRIGFSAGQKAGLQAGTLVAKANMLDALLRLR